MTPESERDDLAEIYTTVAHSANVQLFFRNSYVPVSEEQTYSMEQMNLVDSTLHWAVRTGNLDAVQQILKGGADVNLLVTPPVSRPGCRVTGGGTDATLFPAYTVVSPHDVACKLGYADIAAVLARAGAHVKMATVIDDSSAEEDGDGYWTNDGYWTDPYPSDDDYDDYFGTYHGYELNPDLVDMINPYA